MTAKIEEDFIYFAKMVANRAHEGQVDKLGVPYIEHVEAVARMVQDEWPEDGAEFKPHGIIVAYLHDVVEDTVVTLEGIARYFPKSIVAAVDAITKRDNETRDNYYRRVRSNYIAKHVKRFDVRHNQSRVHLIEDDATRERLMVKYLCAEIALDN